MNSGEHVPVSWNVWIERASEAAACTDCPTMITLKRTSWSSCAIHGIRPLPPGFNAGVRPSSAMPAKK